MDEEQKQADKQPESKEENMESTSKRTNKKRLAWLAISTLIAIVAGVLVWQHVQVNELRGQFDSIEQQLDQVDQSSTQQLSELSSQADGLENNLGNLTGRIDEFLQEQQEESDRYDIVLDAEVLATEDATLRVEEYDNDCYCNVEKEKEVKVVKLKLVNNSQVDVYFGTYSVSGLTSDGKLIESVEVVADDRRGPGLNFQLAPGGEVEAYTYIPDTSITGVYLNDTDESIAF